MTSDFRTRFLQKSGGWLLALLIPLFAVVPLLTHSGLPNTADTPAHLMRQVELNQAWQDGIFFPRWGPDLALGHGMPIFNYAPPLLYYTTQLIHLTGLPLDAAMKGSLILAMYIATFGMVAFSRNLYGMRGGLLAGTLYLYAPYRLREAFIQGNYGQSWGLAWYPVILWAFERLITTQQRRYIFLAAGSLTGLLLSHNISAMLFAPLLAAYVLWLLIGWWRAQPQPTRTLNLTRIKQSPLPGIFLAGITGLGLSAFFWLPAFGEQDLIRLAGITTGFFDFRHNFITLNELLAGPQPLDLAAINPYFPLALGWAQFGFAGLTMLGLAITWLASRMTATQNMRHIWFGLPAPWRGQWLFFVGVLVCYGFMTLAQAEMLWAALPLIELAEFPWRLLGPAVLGAAVLGGGIVTLNGRWLAKSSAVTLALGIIVTIGLNLVYLNPIQFIHWGTPTPADAVRYERDSQAIGTTSTGEFLPRWANQFPTYQTLGPDYEAGRLPTLLDPATLPASATAATVRHTAAGSAININSPVNFTARLRMLYFPRWSMKRIIPAGQPVNINETAIGITEPEGLLTVNLPAGQYQLKIDRVLTPLQRTGNLISLLSFIGLPILAVMLSRYPLTKRSIKASPIDRPGLTEQLLLGLFLLVGPWLVQAFSPQLRLHTPPGNPQGADIRFEAAQFGDELKLLGSTALKKTVFTAGESVALVLFWQANRDLETNYATFLHLTTPNGQTVAGIDQMNPADIPTANWPPDLYLRQPLRLTIPADLPPMRYVLQTGVYNRANGQRLTLPAGSTAQPVGKVWLTSPPATYPAADPVQFGEHISLVYADVVADELLLVWQVDELVDDYAIFIHGLNDAQEIVTQLDGLPFQNQYRTSDWRPGQLIEDRRALSPNASIEQIAIGLYNPRSGERLPASQNGQPLPDNAFLQPVTN